jgi:hypothetical protein
VLRCDVASGARFIAQLSIFVGGLPYKEADEDVLRATFAPFGLIDNVRIIRDKATGVCKGFGYVQFRNESSVEAAVEWGRTGSGGGATPLPLLDQLQPKASRRSKYRNATSTASPGICLFVHICMPVLLSLLCHSVFVTTTHTHTHRNTHNNKLRESSRVAFLKTQKLKCESVNVGEIIAQAKDEGRRRTRGLCFASDPSPTSCASCRQ